MINPKIIIETPSKNLTTIINDGDTSEKFKSPIDMPLKLKIKVKNDIWLNIAVDDSPVENFVLSKGSEKIFMGKTSIS